MSALAGAVPSSAPRVVAPAGSTEQLARSGIWAGSLTLAGVLLSGPVALALVHALGPQPAWTDAAAFGSAYRGVQRLPYAFGVLLVCGCVMMVLTQARASERAHPLRADAARVLASVFAALILLNYVIQTTFVPALLADPSSDALVGSFAMANPASLAWSLEMWGYAFLSVALLLVGPGRSDAPLERVSSGLIVLNAVASVAGAVLTSANQSWVFSKPGLVGFGAWNALMAVLATCFVALWRSRLHNSATAA
jgi:hypothetical protein